MGVYTCQCQDCGEEIEIWFGDRYFSGQPYSPIASTISSRCQNCGAAMEGDGYRLTGDLRAMHLEQEGTWAVKLFNLKDRIFVLKVMREIFNLPMGEARALIQSNTALFAVGTKAEAYYAQEMLKAYGVLSEIILFS